MLELPAVFKAQLAELVERHRRGEITDASLLAKQRRVINAGVQALRQARECERLIRLAGVAQ
jgi:hypothetical protein